MIVMLQTIDKKGNKKFSLSRLINGVAKMVDHLKPAYLLEGVAAE